jgi:hypothetical protein
VPRTEVPPPGPITVVATGQTPGLVFHQPGHATVTVDSGLSVHLVPKNASGSTVFGEVDASCTLDPGQNTVLASFEITAVPTGGGATGGGPAGSGATRPTGGPAASGTRATVTAGPSGPGSSPTTSAALSSAASQTAQPSATTAHDETVATASTARLAAVDPLLVGGGILAVGAGCCVWWLQRRRRRGGQRH